MHIVGSTGSLRAPPTLYIGQVINDVKGTVHVFLIAPQMGEGEKREGVQISEQSTQNI